MFLSHNVSLYGNTLFYGRKALGVMVAGCNPEVLFTEMIKCLKDKLL